jgi:F0F1-type ATP synthase membrane subunit b/b'
LDSSLVSLVRDIEAQAEAILQEAHAMVASEKAETMQRTDTLVKKIEADAAEEAKRHHANSQAELQKELAAVIELGRSSLDQNISKANLMLTKAVQIILERLLGS